MKIGKEKFKLNYKPIILAVAVIFSLTLILGGYALNFSFSESGSFPFYPVKKAQAQTTALYLTNIHISALTSTAATLAWETNLLSDSRVKIGKTTSYEMACSTCSSSDLVKTHRIAIGSLEPGTTYHYQVISKIESGEEKASLDRTFITPQPSNDTVAPSVTRLEVEALQTSAIVYVTTTEEAHVIIAYATSSQANFEVTPDKADDIALPFRVDHVINLSGLSFPTDYFYRVRVIDQAGNSLTSGEFSFTTSDSLDHVFSTGQCSGNIAIGECSNDGYYCDVGTATLVSNCLRCGYQCPAGQSCQVGGVCTNDPSLSGDPYQCNRTDCYRSCSDDDTLSCLSDLECLAASAGACIDDGTFNNPALSGCFSTYPRCDANTILKVKKDRQCAKWLTCGTAIEQVDSKTNQTEELCLNLTACTALGQGNQCVSYADLPKQELTYRSPDEIDQIKWLSGSVIAGLDWQYQEGSPLIRGYYPWSAMTEIGNKLTIKNWNFEETRLVDHDNNADTPQILSYGISLFTNFSKFPEEENPTVISTDYDPLTVSQKDNLVLKVEGMTEAGQGVSIKLDGATNTNSEYTLSLKAKSDSSESQALTFALSGSASLTGARSFGEYGLTTGWQEITTDPIKGPGGADTYLIIYLSNGNTQPFYLDDISLQPVLETQSGVYLKRSCRIYPKEDSATCEYSDDNGIYQKGWYGYCLQRDPSNESICLSWWPVDILYGESDIFGAGEQAGYTGRTPLYYCLESKSNQEPVLRLSETNSVLLGASCIPSDDSSNFSGDDYSVTFDFPAGRNEWNYWNISNTNFNIDEIASFSLSNSPTNGHTGDWAINGYFTIDMAKNSFICNSSSSPLRCPNDGMILGYGENSMGGAVVLDTITFYGINAPSYPEESGNYLLFQLGFDMVTGNLVRARAQQVDRTGDDAEYQCWHMTVRLKETCSKIVQVVKDDGTNSAWAENIKSESYIVDNLGYKIGQDLNPFGGSVTLSGEPDSWTMPLFAEDPDTYNYSTPYQVRSGSPYACFGDCTIKVCMGGGSANGRTCTSNTQCVDSADSTITGLCIGVGSSAASNRGTQYVYGSDSYSVSDETFAQSRLMGLFAQSYGLWHWDPSAGSYVKTTTASTPEGFTWNSPTTKCADNSRLAYDINNAATYCGIAPRITNLKLGDGASNIVKLGLDGGKVKLSFNTIVDRQQQPLKIFHIDWGDGQIQPINYGYKAKDDSSNPHIYTHAYSSCLSENCRYNIKILAEDNWGWCSAQPESRPNSCLTLPISRWDPVDACSGGTCSDGICSDDSVDKGRACGEFFVELINDND